MTPLMITALGSLMVATAFLSGLFGMAGGLILIGVLLTLMPLPSAMVLHAISTVAGYYLIYGSWLLLARGNAFAF